MSNSQQSTKNGAGRPVPSVEEYHKSIKQNDFAKSPTRTLQTQTNHLKFANKMSHFALKTKIYQQALKAAFKELTILKQTDQIVT